MSLSSSTLWATASKEWIIQPKPKPGRKPKKDVPITSNDDSEVDVKGRRIQNRTAQRAFRERKQSQLSELQARIQLYEQGEIERNVALQNIAKRLKEENEKLRKANSILQEKLAEAQASNKVPATSLESHAKKRRWRDDPSFAASYQSPQSKKKSRTEPLLSHPILPGTHLPSPASMVSSPEASGHTDTQFSVGYNDLDATNHSAFETFGSISSEIKTADVLSSFPSLGCGFCDGGSICLCHEISVHDVVDRANDSTEVKTNNFSEQAAQINSSKNSISQEIPRASILDNLPAYQPPVPLRRRPGGVLSNSVFSITPVSGESNANATCSGDPSDCPACGDDAFGKAFCSAIRNTGSEICSNCPSRTTSTNVEPTDCCCSGTCGDCPAAKFPSSSITSGTTLRSSSEYIATNDAWRKLKAHPNVEFADLTLLAEVVASRSMCMGPHIKNLPQASLSEDMPGQFIHSQSLTQAKTSSPRPQLVPQEILLECGRRRLRHVHAEGVKEALRLLDAKFS